MKVAIRADASASIGTGHVMRCLNLARELRRRSAEVVFVHRQQCGNLVEMLEREFTVYKLPKVPLKVSRADTDLYNYSNEDTNAQVIDADQTLRCLDQFKPDWIIVDCYDLSTGWEERLRQGMRVLVIDDLANRAHDCDMLVDQNWFGVNTTGRYQSLVPKGCKVALGPNYALLRPEFGHLHRILPTNKGVLRRVLVSFGGMDRTNQTGKTIEALSGGELEHLAVDVVVGPNFPHIVEIEKMLNHLPGSTLHRSMPSLAALMLYADLAVGGSGVTMWERCCLGLPSIVVSVTDEQVPICKALAVSGAVRYLGQAEQVTASQLRANLVEILTNKEFLLQGSRCGRQITDGLGTLRVASMIAGLQYPVLLRPASEPDECLLLRWANDQSSRDNSFPQDLIDRKSHHVWFTEKLLQPESEIFIAEMTDGMPVGQIRFDRQRNGDTLVDVSVDSDFRGLGIGAQIIVEGRNAIQKIWPGVTIMAEVFDDNGPSKTSFLNAGFHKVKPLGRQRAGQEVEVSRRATIVFQWTPG